MTGDEVIRLFDAIPRTVYPPYPAQPVTINGDQWAGYLVVKVADVLAIVGTVARALDRERFASEGGTP